jgi:phenylacetate-CoA ligase
MKSLEDILYPFLKVYNALPLFIRNSVGKVYRLLPQKIRYGNFFSKYCQRINLFQNNDNEVGLSQNLLLNQVNYAIENIPFYQQYEPIDSIEELIRLPVVDKETIAENSALFINPSLKSRGLKSNTGGSSGTPFSFLIEKGITRPKEAAHFNWYWRRYGFKPGNKVLMIRGKSLRNNADFEHQAIGNKLVVSCYNLNQVSIKEIYKQILKFKPKFIHAYPSSLLIFTKELQLYLKDRSPAFEVNTIFLGSEYLFEQDKTFFEKFYHSKAINWYGHSECLIHGGKCELSGDYHFYPFYGYVELVDENDNLITKPNIEGRIIATGFDNKVMPLIRYDTGDIGAYSEKQECECGFKGKSLSKIVGRGKDFIVLKDGTKVTLTAFVFGQHHEEFSKIREMQLIQNKSGEVLLNVVPLNDFSLEEQNKLKNRLTKSVHNDRGKHRLLIQNITQ